MSKNHWSLDSFSLFVSYWIGSIKSNFTLLLFCFLRKWSNKGCFRTSSPCKYKFEFKLLRRLTEKTMPSLSLTNLFEFSRVTKASRASTTSLCSSLQFYLYFLDQGFPKWEVVKYWWGLQNALKNQKLFTVAYFMHCCKKLKQKKRAKFHVKPCRQKLFDLISTFLCCHITSEVTNQGLRLSVSGLI